MSRSHTLGSIDKNCKVAN